MPEERKLVTVLFADVIGSTAMSGAYDPEVVRAALDGAFDRIAPIIESHGGTVEKFIGDAVMAVFGVPRTHDDDAERAIRAALRIREAIASIRDPLPLEVRIGVSSGEAVARGDGGDQRLVTGLAVNLAQRLESSASPGEILVGDLAHRLTERAIRYGIPREVEAKGIGKVEAWPVVGPTIAPAERGRTTEGLRAPIVGRKEELRRLRGAYERVLSDQRPVLMTVFGPPGTGKSRLAEEALAHIHPGAVLSGRCVPYGERLTVDPLQQMLRADAGIGPDDPRDEAIATLRGRIAEVIGPDQEVGALQDRLTVLAGVTTASEALPDVAEQDVSDELRWAFRRYVERRAGAEGAILLFEDIHWASSTVLDLIEHLTDWARAPVLILCLARPDLREALPMWGGGRSNSLTIELPPLSARETTELIRKLLAADSFPEEIAGEVFARSEGNPLYVEEFVRALIETGRVVREGGTWVSVPGHPIGVPPTLQGLIAARLDRVPPDVKRFLQEAAIIGRTFSSSALTVLHGSPVAGLLREAVESDVLEESEAWARGRGAIYRFRHVLFHEVAYGMLPKTDRSRLHDRYREWSETTTDEPRDEQIAHHAEQAYLLATEVRSADAGHLARVAFDRMRSAADGTRARGDLRSSLGLWRAAQAIGRSIELPDREQIEVDGSVLLLRTSFEQGDELWREVDKLVVRARDIGPSEMLVRILVAAGWREYTSSIERSAELMQEAHTAARSLGDHELITHTLLQLSIVPLARGDLKELGRMREEALSYAKTHGVTRELPSCLRALAEWALRSGEFSRAATLLEEAERLAQERGSKAARFGALLSRVEIAIWTGPWDEAVALARRLGPLVEDLATLRARINYLVSLGLALFEAGDVHGSRAAHEEAVRSTDSKRTPFEFAYSAIHLIFPLVALGELTEAQRLETEVARIDIPWQNHWAMQAAVAAVLYEAEGNVERAEVFYRRSIAIFEQATTALTRRHWAEQQYAEFLVRRGRVAEAGSLLERVLSFYSDPLAAPRQARILRLLGREPPRVDR